MTEGFGLPPLEAMACGCVVFSSLNHALADHGDPGRMVHQIGCGRLAFDVYRIEDAVRDPAGWRPPAAALNALLEGSSEATLLQRWTVALDQLDALDNAEGPLLSSPPTWSLKLQKLCQRLQRVVDRLPGWPSTR